MIDEWEEEEEEGKDERKEEEEDVIDRKEENKERGLPTCVSSAPTFATARSMITTAYQAPLQQAILI